MHKEHEMYALNEHTLPYGKANMGQKRGDKEDNCAKQTDQRKKECECLYVSVS